MEQLNELPQGWKWVKLGEVCYIEMGQSPSGESYNKNENGIPLLNGTTEFGKIEPTPIQWTTEPTKLAQKGDILFCVRGSTTGKKNIADRTYCIGRGLALIRGIPNESLTEFLYLLLDNILDKLLLQTSGSTFPNLSGENLKNFIIPLPPYTEQQRLAELLSKKLALIEQAKEKITAQLQAAEQLTAAYLREVFESEEAKGWELVKLGDICQINPTRKPIKRKDDELTSFIPMAAIDANLGKVTKLEEQPFIKIKKGYTYFEENDVLFAKITPCMENGKQAIAKNLIDGFGFGTTEFHVIRPNEKIIPEWIFYFVRKKTFLEEAAKNFTGSVGQQRVPKEFLEKTEISLPSTDKQKQLAHYLSEKIATVEQLKSHLQNQLDSINQLPAALLKQAFTGQL